VTSLRLGAVQMSMSTDIAENVARADDLVRRAAAEGARIVVIPELFEDHYFCKDVDAAHMGRAHPIEGHPTVDHFRSLARELEVVIPVSVFERAGNALYNSLAVVDADGSLLGTYRKSHIPDGPGYSEKFYFVPGDTGFRVWDTAHGRVGTLVCWDQWFPEAARALALAGAEVIVYPTAIGSEPQDPSWDSSGHWRRVMQGHAAANLVPVVAANRHGVERGATCEITFYGTSFICDQTGRVVAEAGRDEDAVLTAEFDREELDAFRLSWGLFRDRRPDLYATLLGHDGTEPGGQ
jgi:N-carbamoylputrescine amidase